MASKKPDPRKGKAGRKTKLTPERQATICGLIRRGIPQKSVVVLAGISTTTFSRWMQEGAEDEKAEKASHKREFWAAVTRALPEGEAFLADKWRKITTEGTTKTSKTWKDVIVKETTEKPDGSKVTTEKVVRVLDRELVETVGDGDWRGIEAYLERRWPESWAKPKQRLEVEDVTDPDRAAQLAEARERFAAAVARRREAASGDAE